MKLLDFQIFDNISPTSRAEIEALKPKIYYYDANNICVRNGEELKYVLLIKKGCLKTAEYMINGREIISSYYSEGDAFPFYLHYGGYNYFPYDVYANKKSEVYFVPFDQIKAIIDKDPILMQNVLDFVSEYTCYNKFVLRSIQYNKISQRVAYWLLHSNEIDSLKLPKTQKMLADILHINRSCLNTELKDMESRGIIKVDGIDIEVLDPDKLVDMI